MIASLISAIAPLDELALGSAHRSRIAFRFNVGHRRQVMVQLVSVPARQNSRANGAGAMPYINSTPASLGQLVDEYCVTHGLTRWL